MKSAYLGSNLKRISLAGARDQLLRFHEKLVPEAVRQVLQVYDDSANQNSTIAFENMPDMGGKKIYLISKSKDDPKVELTLSAGEIIRMSLHPHVTSYLRIGLQYDGNDVNFQLNRDEEGLFSRLAFWKKRKSLLLSRQYEALINAIGSKDSFRYDFNVKDRRLEELTHELYKRLENES